jgi:hypothetical protein
MKDERTFTEYEELDDTSMEQQVLEPAVENYPDMENPLQNNDGKEIIEFWDNNGFGFSNVNANSSS